MVLWALIIFIFDISNLILVQVATASAINLIHAMSNFLRRIRTGSNPNHPPKTVLKVPPLPSFDSDPFSAANLARIILIIPPIPRPEPQPDPDPEINTDLFTVYYLFETGEAENTKFSVHVTGETTVPAVASHLVIDNLDMPHVYLSREEKEFHFIFSTKSGFCLAEAFREKFFWSLHRAVRRHFKSECPVAAVHDVKTDSAHFIQDYVKSLLSPKGNPLFVMFSGDGGVVELINAYDANPALRSRNAEIHVVPFGTGNGLFHSIHRGIPREHGQSDLVQSLRTLFHGASIPMATFTATFPGGGTISKKLGRFSYPSGVQKLTGAVVASHGLHACLVAESDNRTYRKHGSRRFAMAAEELMKINPKFDIEVLKEMPDKQPSITRRSDANYFMATMASALDKGFVISPKSNQYSRPLMSLIIKRPQDPARFFEIMGGAFNNGVHVDMPEVEYEETKKLEITTFNKQSRFRKFCVDGTIVTVPKGGKIVVERQEDSPFRVVVQPFWYVEKAATASTEVETSWRDMIPNDPAFFGYKPQKESS